jgi:hypothetical protein
MEKQELIDQLLLLPSNELEELLLKVINIKELPIGYAPGDHGWEKSTDTKYVVTVLDLGSNPVKVKLYIKKLQMLSVSNSNRIGTPYELIDTYMECFAEQYKKELGELGASVQITKREVPCW